MNILLAEDDTDLRNILTQYLELQGFTIYSAENGKVGLELFKNEHVDLCILDIMMPVMDGFALAQKIRKLDSFMPVIFLTAKSQKADKIKGLKIGADDYITKPFEVEELILRIKNILRRSGRADGETLSIGGFEFRFDELTLKGYGQEHQMTLKEAELLKYLLKNSNRVLKREQLLKELWGEDDYFLGRSMDVFITRLRKYLQPENKVSIDNIRGVGFILRMNE
ncbi:MAG: transcriptional regulator [Bacteroides sp. SM23_62_1]|nr:MAG: transcriptional regulator [Bacteroides sp. SM23_62_1]